MRLRPARHSDVLPLLREGGLVQTESDGDQWFVVRGHDAGPPIGCCAMRKVGRTAYLHGFYIVPAWRGIGLGREMVEGLERLAGEHGSTKMSVHCFPEHEPFWASRGFRVVHRYKVATRMVKP